MNLMDLVASRFSGPDRDYRLASISDGFGALRDNGGGPLQAPGALAALRQQQAQAQQQDALRQAAQGMGLMPPQGQEGPQSPPQALAAAGLYREAIAAAGQRNPKGSKELQLFNERQANPEFSAYLDSQNTAKERRIVKAADGRNYYADTQEPVLPGLQNGPKPADFDSETKLRKEFSAVSSDFPTVRDAYSRIESSAKDPSAAGDLAMIFNYMKVLDPGSVVRESEFATAANSAGVPDRIRATYNKVLSGERLADAQRADFLNRGQRLYQGRLEQYGKTEAEYRRLAESYEFDPSRIVPDFNLPGGGQAITAPPQGPRKTINGTVYEQRNGKWGKVQ